MKPGTGIATMLFGLVLLPALPAAAEAGEAAKLPKSRVHSQLNRLIREEAGIAPPAATPAEGDSPDFAEETLELEPMIVEEEKLKNLPPPETRMEKIFRTGTIWRKVGRKFTKEFWLHSDRGIGFTLSW